MMKRSVLGTGLTGETLTDLERRILDEMTPYSVILFSRNIGTEEQLVSLVRDIKSYGERPPLVVIDQEGGRVDRLRTLIPGVPGAAQTASVRNAEPVAHRLGELIGEALRFFDIDVNLAPVVDIEREEPVKGLERRTWGRDVSRVVALSGAFIKGQHRIGVGSCLKHFPGLGAGYGDPHYGASLVEVDADELETVDLAPYRQLGNEAGAVMIGHSLYPALEDEHVPASLSRRISTGLLREVIGFEGVSFSDDMEMHAVSDLAPFEEIGERALSAGNDVIFFCSQIERLPDITKHLDRRRESDAAFAARFEQASDRAEAFRDRCQTLRTESADIGRSFDQIRESFAEFCEEFDRVCHTEEEDRRAIPRTPGTGKTGREEWT